MPGEKPGHPRRRRGLQAPVADHGPFDHPGDEAERTNGRGGDLEREAEQALDARRRLSASREPPLDSCRVDGMLSRTLDGHVGNGRERAIYKLFNCLSCEQVRRICRKMVYPSEISTTRSREMNGTVCTPYSQLAEHRIIADRKTPPPSQYPTSVIRFLPTNPI